MNKIYPICCTLSMCVLFLMCFLVYKVNDQFNTRFMKQFDHNINLANEMMIQKDVIQNQNLYIENLRIRLGEIPEY